MLRLPSFSSLVPATTISASLVFASAEERFRRRFVRRNETAGGTNRKSSITTNKGLITSLKTSCWDVIHLMTRKNFSHPKAWMHAVEMTHEGRLRGVDYSGHLRYRCIAPNFCPCRISKYLNPKKLKNRTTIQVDMCGEESDQAGGLENLATVQAVAMDAE